MFFISSAVQTKSIFLGEQEKARFAQLRKNFPGDQQPPGFRTREMMYASQALMHHFAGDLEQAYLWANEGQELYRENPQFIADQPFRYVVSKSNLINRCMNLEKHAEALQHIGELKAFMKGLDKFNRQDIGEEHPVSLLNWLSRLYFTMERRGEALKEAKEFERSADLKRLRPHLRLMADSSLARIYFYNGLYKESLRCVNRQLREGPDSLRADFLLFAHLLRLCISAEMNDHDLLDPHLGAVKRFLKKHEVKHEFVLQFVEMMKELGRAHEEEAQRRIMEKFYDPLGRSAKEAEQYAVILDWVRTKMQRQR